MGKNKAYCGGILCKKYQRKFKCGYCKEYLCGYCMKSSMKTKKIYCPDCYVGIILVGEENVK